MVAHKNYVKRDMTAQRPNSSFPLFDWTFRDLGLRLMIGTYSLVNVVIENGQLSESNVEHNN